MAHIHRHANEPDDWVRRFQPLVEKSAPVLDLACGAGRHARLFLASGHDVVAADRDVDGLGDLEGAERLEMVACDLEAGAWPFAGRRFAAIVVVNYLHRPLFAAIAEALAPGGALIYRTFAKGNEAFGKPSNPDYLLRPGELLDAFAGRLDVIAFEEGYVEKPRPAVIQRLCALKARGGGGAEDRRRWRLDPPS